MICSCSVSGLLTHSPAVCGFRFAELLFCPYFFSFAWLLLLHPFHLSITSHFPSNLRWTTITLSLTKISVRVGFKLFIAFHKIFSDSTRIMCSSVSLNRRLFLEFRDDSVFCVFESGIYTFQINVCWRTDWMTSTDSFIIWLTLLLILKASEGMS